MANPNWLKGHVPWNKGMKGKYSLKHNGQFKEGHPFGKRFEKDHIPWNKGKKRLEISGKDHPMWGKTHTQEAREKIRKAHLGKKWSEEQRGKMVKWRENNPDILRENGLLGLKAQAKKEGPNSIEKKVYEELKRRGLLFETQKLINGKFLVDAYIPKLNLVIECDGDYWHSLDRVKKKDKAENAYLRACGYGLLRLSETDINNQNYIEVLKERR